MSDDLYTMLYRLEQGQQALAQNQQGLADRVERLRVDMMGRLDRL